MREAYISLGGDEDELGSESAKIDPRKTRRLRPPVLSAVQQRLLHIEILEDDLALEHVRDQRRELEEKLRSPRKDPWARIDLLGSNGGKPWAEGMDRDPYAAYVPQMRVRLVG